MTNEERRRTMEFILEQQAQLTANVQQHEEYFKQLKEERIRDRPRLARLEESFLQLVELNKTVDSRLDSLESRTNVFETNTATLQTNMAALAAAQAHADERLSALIDIVRQDRESKL